MSLWTPYAEETALDLSTKYPSDVTIPEYVYPSVNYVSYPVYVPAPDASPLSSCSGYVPQPSGSPHHRSGLISPPESPRSADRKRPSYMIDVDSLSDDPDFQAFERDALRAMAEKNGGTLLGNNPRMRRAVHSTHTADDSYRRQRERNNHAAKQSRDRRKLREIHLALKVTYLKNEVSRLKSQLATKACIRCHQSCIC
ncbi:transcription factor VBP-like [Leptidea sinapis]|uniref:transcription factor VBP-like n=1 Tax=Leptidea sinapis TaxID=189913 RepID=UPI0021C3F047|nr:transcription factor VBP-like [Leptidea sinapis]